MRRLYEIMNKLPVYLALVLLLLLLLLLLPGCLATPGELMVTCPMDQFRARCPLNSVIFVLEARYGRMQLGGCVRKSFGMAGCHSDVRDVMDRKCSGRRECQVPVPNPLFEGKKPCSELQSYLEVRYNCTKIAPASQQSCGTCQHMALPPEAGYVLNSVTERTGCGGIECPWLLQLMPGQSLMISLVDFGEAQHINPKSCNVYAVLKERRKGGRSETVCGGLGRIRDVFNTTTPQIEVRIQKKSSNSEPIRFLLKYAVSGCSDQSPVSSEHSFRRLSALKSRVWCRRDEQVGWTLHCNATKWQGEIGNCATDSPVSAVPYIRSKISYSFSIIIVVTIALFISAFILVVGLVCLRRLRSAGTRTSSRLPAGPMASEATYSSPPARCLVYRESGAPTSLGKTTHAHAHECCPHGTYSAELCPKHDFPLWESAVSGCTDLPPQENV